MPIINNYYPGDCTQFPLLDIMEEVQRVLGYRCKLDDLAAATLGERKSGHGLDAVRYWREGQLEKLKAYCLDDVRLTRDLYRFGLAHGVVYLMDRAGVKKKISIDFTRAQEKKSLNLTLGI